MPNVDIMINGRAFSVQFGSGEELRLKRLAQYVDARVREQVQQHGPLGDATLLMLTSLLIADELDDALAEIKRLQSSDQSEQRRQETESNRAVDRVAERLERLAAALERP